MKRVSVGRTVVIVCGVIAVGCSADQSIQLNADGSGFADISIQLDPALFAYLSDLQMGFGDSSGHVFDSDAIAAGFLREPGIELRSIAVPSPDRLVLQVAFTSIGDLRRGDTGVLSRLLRYETTPRLRRLFAAVDRDGIEGLLDIAGIDPFVGRALLPPERGMTAAAYRDYLAWALEEYAGRRSLQTVFAAARVATEVTVAGALQRVRGGEGTGTTARFITPLVEAVVSGVDHSLVFEVE